MVVVSLIVAGFVGFSESTNIHSFNDALDYIRTLTQGRDDKYNSCLDSNENGHALGKRSKSNRAENESPRPHVD